MKKKLIILLLIFNFGAKGQSIQWSKLFDLHSQNASGGLSTNSLFDNDGNIITPVIENNYLNIYKLNPTDGEVITVLNTNFVSGQITNIVETTQDNYALIFNNTPLGLNESYKIIYFDSELNLTNVSDLILPFSSSLNKILSFFKVNNKLYITVNAFSSINYFLLQINSSNQLIEKYNIADSISLDHISTLNNGNIIIDFTENHYHSIKCINPETGQLIWQNNYSNSDLTNLNYKVVLDNQDNIYLSQLIREWNDSNNSFDTIFIKKIDSSTGSIIENISFNPLSNCSIRIEDIMFNSITSFIYLIYLDCNTSSKIHIQQYSNSLQLNNEITIDSPSNIESSSYAFFKSSLMQKDDGSLILVNRRYVNANELENIHISSLSSNMNTLNMVELNIPPKNGDEIQTDVFLQNEKLIITGFIPSTDSLISWEEVQYFISLINLNGALENIDFENNLSIKIVPNPVDNIIAFQTQINIKEVLVYDMLGEKVFVNQISNNSLDVSNLTKGVYIINLYTEDAIDYKIKFLKN